jgi:cyanophycinase
MEDLPGALVIVGGGGTPPLVHDEFFRLAGDAAARVLHIPSATRTFDDIPNKREYYCEFYGRGVASFDFLHTYDRAVAEDPAFAAPLESATGVWIGGGTQSRLAALLLETPVLAGLRRLLDRGGVVGGTSSGCAIMSDAMIEFGYTEIEFGQGFALLQNSICDPHFTERERQRRVPRAALLRPDHVAIGIDEKTALVVERRELRVIGPGETAAYFHFADRESLPNSTFVRRYKVAVGESVRLPQSVRSAPLEVLEQALATTQAPHIITAEELIPTEEELSD